MAITTGVQPRRVRYSDEDVLAPAVTPQVPPQGQPPVGPVGSGPEPPPAPPAPPAPPPAPPTFQREQFRDDWMGTGTDVNRQNALLAQFGLTPDAAGRVRLPTGETIDLRIGAKSGQNLAGWTGVAGGELKTGQTAGAAPLSMGGSSGGGQPAQPGTPTGAPGTPTAAGAPPTNQGLDEELRRAISELLTNSRKPVDPNDPIIKGQTDAYRTSQTRNEERMRAAIAERLASQGLGQSGAIDSEMNSVMEGTGENVSGFQAQLMGRELGDRRNQLMQTMQLLQGRLSDQDRLAMQKELAALDAELRRLGISTQNNQFNAQLGQQGQQFNDQYGLGLLNTQNQNDQWWANFNAGLL